MRDQVRDRQTYLCEVRKYLLQIFQLALREGINAQTRLCTVFILAQILSQSGPYSESECYVEVTYPLLPLKIP